MFTLAGLNMYIQKRPKLQLYQYFFVLGRSNFVHTFPWRRHQMETFPALLAIWPVNSSHKGQWRGALMFSLICLWRNGWVNNRDAGDLRRYRAHYDVTVMYFSSLDCIFANRSSAFQPIRYAHGYVLLYFIFPILYKIWFHQYHPHDLSLVVFCCC